MPSSESLDPFDSILTLEDSLYTSTYAQGQSDGARLGRIEGRVFGLEKGFKKFATLGELHGRSVVWGARLSSSLSVESKGEVSGAQKERLGVEKLPEGARLKTNITLLHSLTDPLTFSTENTEEAVADFDDRFKRAGMKAKVIRRIIGEDELSTSKSLGQGTRAKENKSSRENADISIEDFVGP